MTPQTPPLNDLELLALPLEKRLRALYWQTIRHAIQRCYQDEKPESIGSAVIHIRDRMKMSTREFARVACTNFNTVSQLERGHRSTTPALLLRLADLAENCGLGNHGNYLRSESLLREREIFKHGGKR